MRKGFNPQKNKKIGPVEFFHQVVIPVYIPHQEDYFKDSFKILQLCINSLIKTIHNQTFITVVNNGSCKEVEDFLIELFRDHKIQELVNTTNIGYINAMLKGIAGQNFPYFTNADADVLFLNGWQEESYKLFDAFPRVGAVSPVPNPRMVKFNTSNIIWEQGFGPKLKFTKTRDPEALISFSDSINNPTLFKEVHLQKYLTICEGDLKGVVGAGHFIVTYKAHIFKNLESRSTDYLLGGNSDSLFDDPVFMQGYWRLATEGNFALHMGNVWEDWMEQTVDELEITDKNYGIPILQEQRTNKFVNWLISNFFSKFIFKKSIWRLYLRYKGLSKVEAENY